MESRKLSIKPRIFILCNGELAEPLYFKDFKNYLRTHNIVVSDKKEFIKKAPWDFIKAAIKYKKELESKKSFIAADGDQIWCVFDVDRYWDDNEKEFHKALALASQKGLKIAYSNECFELWFLCHFDLHNSAISRVDYHKKLEKYFKDKGLGYYRKNMRGIFEPLLPFQGAAIKHAKKLHKGLVVQSNPSTSVFILVEELLKYFS